MPIEPITAPAETGGLPTLSLRACVVGDAFFVVVGEKVVVVVVVEVVVVVVTEVAVVVGVVVEAGVVSVVVGVVVTVDVAKVKVVEIVVVGVVVGVVEGRDVTVVVVDGVVVVLTSVVSSRFPFSVVLTALAVVASLVELDSAVGSHAHKVNKMARTATPTQPRSAPFIVAFTLIC